MKYFQPSDAAGVSNMTSNITHILSNEDLDLLMEHVKPRIMRETFGEGNADHYDRLKGYTDPDWYFTGPGDVVLGIGFRYGRPRIRGKNVENQFSTPEEIGSMFMSHIMISIENELQDLNGGV